jgi:hypothetical protein
MNYKIIFTVLFSVLLGASSAIADDFEDFKESVRDGIESTRDAAIDAYEDSKDAAVDMYDDSSEAVIDSYEQVRKDAKKSIDDVADTIELYKLCMGHSINATRENMKEACEKIRAKKNNQ